MTLFTETEDLVAVFENISSLDRIKAAFKTWISFWKFRSFFHERPPAAGPGDT